MKKSLVILLMVPVALLAQETGTGADLVNEVVDAVKEPTFLENLWGYVLAFFAGLTLPRIVKYARVIVGLTPSTKDDELVEKVIDLLERLGIDLDADKVAAVKSTDNA